jgi:hypothetical protein
MKNKLRNKIGDEYLNNCLVIFIEREYCKQVKDEDVINLCQKRRSQSYTVISCRWGYHQFFSQKVMARCNIVIIVLIIIMELWAYSLYIIT